MKKITSNRILIFCLVFFAGFANLATEIIGPRLVASLFGSTTIIWAIIISVTLIGISVGYFIGGRVPSRLVLGYLPGVLILNAIWLVAVSWLIWLIPADLTAGGYLSIGLISVAAFFPPAVLFSMISPLMISHLSAIMTSDQLPREVGNIYAIGTLGSVLGALVAAFMLIPYVGLSNSLKLFAIGAVIFAIVFGSWRMRLAGLAVLLFVVISPNPVFHGQEDASSILLAQSEGYYQTIRVYTDNATYIRMDLGPTFHTKMRLSDKEPVYGYAAEMVRLAGDVQDKKILIIGGAGHTQARALERRGANVTEVEIDPFVVKMSDQYFGAIQGAVIVADGRAYLEGMIDEKYDLILVDAFDGLASIPVQLTTQEFFQAVRRALSPQGRLIYNFIGITTGARSNSFRAISTTMGSVFPDTRAYDLGGEGLTNVVLIASQMQMVDITFPAAPTDGTVLTDDLNPIEIYFEQARKDYLRH